MSEHRAEVEQREPASIPAAADAAPAPAAAAATADPCRMVLHDLLEVEVAGYRGSLEGLVLAVQRGEIDPAPLVLRDLTGAFRARVDATDGKPAARQIADFLTLAARLVALKANRLLPEGGGLADDEVEEEAVPGEDAGRRLAEYRLFKAAAEALLAEASEEGTRSFLGLVVPEVIPVERLAIPPERLAQAFRAVLERLPSEEPLPVGMVTFSVEDKAIAIRALLSERGRLHFEDLFVGVGSRLEAVACFLGLLELLRGAEVRVDQLGDGRIVVRSVG